jgi:carbamoyl-phosphate synthase large subunit
VLEALKVPVSRLGKQPGEGLTAMDAIDQGLVDLVINVPREYDQLGRPDGYLIRRRAVDAGIPLLTDIHLARAVVAALSRHRSDADLRVLAWDEYRGRSTLALR